MPKFNIISKPANDTKTKKNKWTPKMEYLQLYSNIMKLAYDEDGPHKIAFMQLQSIATNIEDKYCQHSTDEQKKPILYPQVIMILLGASLFTQKQIQVKNILFKVNISNIHAPGGRLMNEIDQLTAVNRLKSSDNAENAMAFAKRAFYEWYKKTNTLKISDTEQAAAIETCFNLDDNNIESDAVRDTAEETLELFAKHLSPIHEDQYQYLITHKHLNESDYTNTPRASNGLVMDTVSGTAGVVASVVSTGLGYVSPLFSFFGSSSKPTADTKAEKNDAVQVDTSALANTASK